MTASVPAPLAGMCARAAVPMAVLDVVDGAPAVVAAASESFGRCAGVDGGAAGRPLDAVLPDGADALAGIVRDAAAGDGASVVLDAEAAALGEYTHWSATPVPNEDGRITHVLLASTDGGVAPDTARRIEMLEGVVQLSRRVSSAELGENLYGVLAADIGLLLGCGLCVILRLDTPSNRDPATRVVRPMLPAYGVDASGARGASMTIDPGSAAWQVVFAGDRFASDDVAADPALAGYREFFVRFGAYNGAAIPMRVRGTTSAVLLVGNKPGGFSDDDLDQAEIFAAEAALAIENARLFAEEHRVASTLQEALLPGPMPPVPGLDLAAIYRPAGPAGSVGGDFYDVFAMPGDRFALMLGDVSGKGPRAAAQTALVRHMARGLALNDRHPGPVAARLNEAVWEAADVEGFITMLFGVYDPESEVLRWANAGHPRPLFWRRGRQATELGAPGRALGISRRSDLRVDRVRFAPGDVFVWFTDGIAEARRPGGEMLGVTPLLRELETVAERPSAEIAEALYDRAVRHCGRLEDDVALLVGRKTD